MLIVCYVFCEGLVGYCVLIEVVGYGFDWFDVCDFKFVEVDFLMFDFVILMGGLMGVYEGFLYLWIVYEIECVVEWLEYGLLILGVCFGV